MSKAKRTVIREGLFETERVTFDLAAPEDAQTWAEFCRVSNESNITGLVAYLEKFAAAQMPPPADVLSLLDNMHSALAIAKQGGLRDAVLMAVQAAERC